MLKYVTIFTFCLFISCQKNEPIPGNEILFTEVIGDYAGRCAHYTTSKSDLTDQEDATLTVYAATTDQAGITVTCDRIEDYKLSVKEANASTTIFEESVGTNIKVNMTYISASDSLVVTIMNSEASMNNLIFTGRRI